MVFSQKSDRTLLTNCDHLTHTLQPDNCGGQAVHLGSIESSTRQQWSECDVRNRYTTTDFCRVSCLG
ncbi:hypothetical protein [Fischerella thermalis]|uniref:hypothetical protein n=1 Tax=Fischerella thermalis TaxID=372787 RepID=UPI0015E06106|nr:hypothetical protein [Fischerella thermalis]